MILVDDKPVQEGTRDKRLKWFSCESPILVELDLNMLVLVFLKVIPFTRNSKSCNENFARVDSFSHILISPWKHPPNTRGDIISERTGHPN